MYAKREFLESTLIIVEIFIHVFIYCTFVFAPKESLSEPERKIHKQK